MFAKRANRSSSNSFFVCGYRNDLITSAETLVQAADLVSSGEGLYFVFSQKNMEKSFYKVAGDGAVSS
jgi:hypothetical protein